MKWYYLCLHVPEVLVLHLLRALPWCRIINHHHLRTHQTGNEFTSVLSNLDCVQEALAFKHEDDLMNNVPD